jgi:hypothetical protein
LTIAALVLLAIVLWGILGAWSTSTSTGP